MARLTGNTQRVVVSAGLAPYAKRAALGARDFVYVWGRPTILQRKRVDIYLLEAFPLNNRYFMEYIAKASYAHTATSTKNSEYLDNGSALRPDTQLSSR